MWCSRSEPGSKSASAASANLQNTRRSFFIIWDCACHLPLKYESCSGKLENSTPLRCKQRLYSHNCGSWAKLFTKCYSCSFVEIRGPALLSSVLLCGLCG